MAGHNRKKKRPYGLDWVSTKEVARIAPGLLHESVDLIRTGRLRRRTHQGRHFYDLASVEEYILRTKGEVFRGRPRTRDWLSEYEEKENER